MRTNSCICIYRTGEKVLLKIKFGRRAKGFEKDKADLRLFWEKKWAGEAKRPWGGVCGPSGRLGGAAQGRA